MTDFTDPCPAVLDGDTLLTDIQGVYDNTFWLRDNKGLVTAQLTDVLNVNSGETTLFSYTVPADKINANDKGMRLVAWGTFPNGVFTGHTVFTASYFAGALGNACTIAAGETTYWKLIAEIFRVTGSTYKCVSHYEQNNGLTLSGYGPQRSAGSFNFTTGGELFKITGGGTSAVSGDVKLEAAYVEWIR